MQGMGGRAWEQQIVRGLMTMPAPVEISDALVTALGALGCEAEYGLDLLQAPVTITQPNHTQGEQWLRQCYGLGQRLIQASDELAVTSQAYLNALAESDPTLTAPARAMTASSPADSWAAQFDATPDVWWPERGAVATPRETVELWLRRAGYAYRHTVNVGLPAHLEALSEALQLIMHALRTLPPAGVLTRAALYLGLQELNTQLSGDVIPHHIADLDARHIGWLTGITTILRLGASGRADLDADIAWAQGELARARAAVGDIPVQNRYATRPLVQQTGKLWARQMVADWERIVQNLEALRQPAHVGALSR